MDFKQLDALFSSFSRGCNDEIYSEFIKVTFELVDKLILIFRKYDAVLRKTRDELAIAVGNSNAKEIVAEFMAVMDPLKELVLQQDASVIPKIQELRPFTSMDLEKDFAQLSPRTQQALWGYLGKLIVLGAKCRQAEQVTAPLQDPKYRERLLKTTMECEREFSQNGHDVSSMEDILKMARQINERMK